MVVFVDEQTITTEEIRRVKQILPILTHYRPEETKGKTDEFFVLFSRQFLGYSDLTKTPSVTSAYYCGQFNHRTDPFVMYAWQCLAEHAVEHQVTARRVDHQLLRESIPYLKSLMHESTDQLLVRIQESLNQCGIQFTVQPQLTGAPIKGLTTKTMSGHVLIALSIRGGYVDIFWFTLFHEIAHVLHEDYLDQHSPPEWVAQCEQRADDFACNVLINEEQYRHFIEKGKITFHSIHEFATQHGLLPAIVVSRLQHDQLIKPSHVNGLRPQFKWSKDQPNSN